MTRDPTTRRYTPHGKVAHLIWGPDWSRQDASYPLVHAACGWWGRREYWRGTGNQDEYEKASSMVVCKSCAKAVRRP